VERILREDAPARHRAVFAKDGMRGLLDALVEETAKPLGRG
jgi:hypothetical protein